MYQDFWNFRSVYKQAGFFFKEVDKRWPKLEPKQKIRRSFSIKLTASATCFYVFLIFLLFFPLLNALLCPKFKFKEAKNSRGTSGRPLTRNLFINCVPGSHSFIYKAIGAKQLENLVF